MVQSDTSFDTLLTTARDLALTVVSGQLGPPFAGSMWIGNQSLDAILCSDHAERQVAIMIAPGGPGTTYIRHGQGTLDAAGMKRLTHDAAASGGHVSQGWLAVRTPTSWLTDHAGTPHSAATPATLDMATVAGWPANGGNNPVLFLDDQSIFALLAQANVGRTITLLVGAITS